jgi:hypothetical protein
MPQIDYAINYKNISVRISDGTIITGKINTAHYARLSDYLKATNDKFITITADATEATPQKVSIVNREHIVWADTWD